MGFLDAIFGRSKPPQANLDVLFNVPQAVLTLQAQGFVLTGSAGVCFRDSEGQADDEVIAEVIAMIRLDPQAVTDLTVDSHGYSWLTIRRELADPASLVTDLHTTNTSLKDQGFGPNLLCSTLAFSGTEGPLALVYLFKQGTFYPFAPEAGGQRRRNNALEFQVKGLIESDIPVEKDLSRWLALWDAPALS